jgi:hypothetical protein
MFTRALHWSLSWARSIQSIPPHPVSVRSILILSTHMRRSLHSGLSFLLAFPPISYMHSSCPPIRDTRPAHLILLDLIIFIILGQTNSTTPWHSSSPRFILILSFLYAKISQAVFSAWVLPWAKTVNTFPTFMKSIVHSESLWEDKNIHKYLVEKVKERNNMKDLGIDVNTTLHDFYIQSDSQLL